MLDAYIPILIFCLVTSITPGPNNIMLMTSALNHGVRKSLPHYFGIIIGFPSMVAGVGFGLGTLFVRYPLVHAAIKVLGISYLLYLAWKIANAGNPSANRKLAKPFTFVQAAAFQWVNPKAWVMAIGATATFTTASTMNTRIAIIAVGFATVGGACVALWLLLGASLKKLLNSKRQLQIFNWTMAILLVLSIVPMVFE